MGMLGRSGTPGSTSGHPVGTAQSGTTEWTMEVQNVNVKVDRLLDIDARWLEMTSTEMGLQ